MSILHNGKGFYLSCTCLQFKAARAKILRDTIHAVTRGKEVSMNKGERNAPLPIPEQKGEAE